ncbi:MAG: hypothetical protein KIT84_01035 [Labilithrix sp.]|nr:hypothetical protein [Labilithrix sp.]MCW5809569.1 hypothetical protein [Labilithrix sp.]
MLKKLVEVGVPSSEERGCEQVAFIGELISMAFRYFANEAMDAKESELPADRGGEAALLGLRQSRRREDEEAGGGHGCGIRPSRIRRVRCSGEGDIVGVAESNGLEATSGVDDRLGHRVEDSGAGTRPAGRWLWQLGILIAITTGTTWCDQDAA